MVKIRRMNENDVDFVAQLAILANPYVDASSYRGHIVEELREYPDLSFVAENEEGMILGYVQGEVHGDIGLLEDLAVSESHQGRGIGTLLLKREIEAMKGKGAKIIRAEVHYKCAGAIPFYYKFGFRIAGSIQDLFGAGQDAIILKLEIQKGQLDSP